MNIIRWHGLAYWFKARDVTKWYQSMKVIQWHGLDCWFKAEDVTENDSKVGNIERKTRTGALKK